MTAILWLKYLHVGCVVLSGAGFVLRGIWMLRDSPRLRAPLTRVLPHLIDSVLLFSALGMLWIYRWNPLSTPWLGAKLLALLAYILLGTVALKRGRTRSQRLLAWLAALAVFAYMIGVALTRDPASWSAVMG